MRDTTLFYTITGLSPATKIANKGQPPTPDSPSCTYLEDGHAQEYIMLGSSKKKAVTLFFGPGEFVVQCHSRFSHVETLDNAVAYDYDYSGIFRMLRDHDESKEYYRHFQCIYLEKVAARIRSLTQLSAPERFEELLRPQPWVFELAEEEDIASYLRISSAILREMKK